MVLVATCNLNSRGNDPVARRATPPESGGGINQEVSSSEESRGPMGPSLVPLDKACLKADRREVKQG
jgi:hypothetical protein